MIRKCVSQSGKLLRWTDYACIYSNTDQLELSIKTKCLHFTSRIHSLFKVTRFMVYLVGVHIHLEPMQTHDYCCYAGSVVQFLLPSHHPQVGACMYLTCISTNNKIFKLLENAIVVVSLSAITSPNDRAERHFKTYLAWWNPGIIFHLHQLHHNHG